MPNPLTHNPLVTYIRESKEELKKVTWPSRQTVIRHTIVVFTLSIVVAVFLGTLDYGLSYGLELLLNR